MPHWLTSNNTRVECVLYQQRFLFGPFETEKTFKISFVMWNGGLLQSEIINLSGTPNAVVFDQTGPSTKQAKVPSSRSVLLGGGELLPFDQTLPSFVCYLPNCCSIILVAFVVELARTGCRANLHLGHCCQRMQ